MRKRHYFLGITAILATIIVTWIVEYQQGVAERRAESDRQWQQKCHEDSLYLYNHDSIPWDTISDGRLDAVWASEDSIEVKFLTIRMKKRNVRADLLADRAKCYIRLEKLDSAMADIDRAIRINPNEPHFQCIRTEALIGLGDTVEAKSVLATLTDTTDIYLRAALKWRLGMVEEGLTDLDMGIGHWIAHADTSDSGDVQHTLNKLLQVKPMIIKEVSSGSKDQKEKWSHAVDSIFSKNWNRLPERFRGWYKRCF